MLLLCYLGKCRKIKSWFVWRQGEGEKTKEEVLHLFATPVLQITIRHWVSTDLRGNIFYTYCTLLITDKKYVSYTVLCRSHWPRGLRRRSATARPLGLRVRISPAARMSVYCKCCVLSGRGLCVGLITRPEKSYRLWCPQWVWPRRPVRIVLHPASVRRATNKKQKIPCCTLKLLI